MTAAKLDPIKVGPFRVAVRVRDGQPTGAWFVDIPPHISSNGKRQRLTFSTKTEATAEAKRLLRELQLDGAISGAGPKLSGITFSELAKRWLEEQADRVATGKKRPISLKTDGFRLIPILRNFAAIDGAKIDTKALVTYQKERLPSTTPPTVNSEVALLRRILIWAADRSLINGAPKVEEIPEPRKRVAIPTLEEMARILDKLPPRTALLVRFLAETGCRKGEAFALEWRDLDHVQGVVMIRRKDGWTPKTQGSDRDIAVSASLLEALSVVNREAQNAASAEGKPLNTLVFPGRGGVKMTDFDKALASAVKQAGIMREGRPLNLTPHVLRKAHATWLKQRGIDDTLLQPRLGHVPGSRVTASTYVHMTTDDDRKAIIDLGEERVRRAS